MTGSRPPGRADAARSVRPGEALAGLAGVALLAVLFVDWYAVDVSFTPRGGGATGLSAWTAFSVVDLVLVLVAALGIALAVLNAVGRGPTLPVALGVITVTLAFAATLLVLYRIVNQPGSNDMVEVSAGAWLGLFAAAGVFAGAWWSMGDETPRPVDPPAPEPERRPTPSRS